MFAGRGSPSPRQEISAFFGSLNAWYLSLYISKRDSRFASAVRFVVWLFGRRRRVQGSLKVLFWTFVCPPLVPLF